MISYSSRSSFRAALVLLLCFGSCTTSFAAIAVTDFGTVQINNFGSTDRVLGWIFTVNQDITVTDLGVWDEGMNGLLGSHEIGIWNTGGTLLESTTVQAGTASPVAGPVVNGGQWRYETITNVLLNGGQDYVIGALYDDNDSFESNASFVTTATEITFGLERYTNANSGFVFPTLDAGRIGLYGPNFQFTTAIPEPTTLTLAAFGLLALCRRRKRS